MTIYATKYRPRESGMDETLSYGDVRVSYHASTEHGVMIFANALIDAGHSADQELVILEATKEVRFPSLSLIAGGACLFREPAVAEESAPVIHEAPSATLDEMWEDAAAEVGAGYIDTPVQLSPAAYAALYSLNAEGPAAWAGIAGRLKGRLRSDGLVDDAHEVTARGRGALIAYVAPSPETEKAKVAVAGTAEDAGEPKPLVLSDAAYAALVALQRSPRAWVDLGGRLKGYLRANGLVTDEHEVTEAGLAAMAAKAD